MIPLYLPYVDQKDYDIPIYGDFAIHPFGIAVAVALVVGTWVARWHGQSRGQDPVHIVDACTWTSISGFVIGHLVSVIFYFPDRIAENPLELLYVWNGLSSFGGFFGGAIGAYVYLRRKNLPVLPFVNTIAVGLAPGWVFGRLGCTMAHDHPGLETEFFLGFYREDRGAAFHDLGFYEFLFAICITALVMYVRRLKWPDGSIPAMMCVLYAPVRFCFDYLRIDDTKYMGFTPGQWFAIVLFVGGATLWRYSWSKQKAQKPPSDGSDQKDEESSADPEPDNSPDKKKSKAKS